MCNTDKIEKYVSAMSHLLEKTTLDKVRINDVCDICGTDRQNFYHYFKDKYDLALWIHKLDFMEMYEKCETYSERFIFMFERVWDKRKIYSKLLNDQSQNSVFLYVLNHRNELLSSVFDDYKENASCEKNDLKMLFYFHGSIEMLISWLNGEFEMSTVDMARMLHNLQPKKDI